MLFVRSKLSCTLLWLESRELDFSNLWKKGQVSHTLCPLTTAVGNRERCKANRDAPSEMEVGNGTLQRYEVFLFTQLTLQAVTHNITQREFQIRQFLICRFPLPLQILIFQSCEKGQQLHKGNSSRTVGMSGKSIKNF